jgi:pyridoxal 5'-phosphate synthase pdxT subunit
VLASRHGEPVMAREGNILVATFHPELTDDPTVHRYFCEMVAQSRRARRGPVASARGLMIFHGSSSETS